MAEKPAVKTLVSAPASLEYNYLLERAYQTIPAQTGTGERFKTPVAEVMLHGVKTYIMNFEDIARALRRQPDEIAKWLYREMAVPGVIEGKRLALNGKFNTKGVNEKITAYTAGYVICRECGKPDTHLEEQGRGFATLVCEACGARRPIRM